MRVQTWANGFGVWHARVSRTAASPLIAARRAIRDEFQARESPSAPVARYVWMSLVRVEEHDDAETIVYRESDTVPPEWVDYANIYGASEAIERAKQAGGFTSC